VKRKVLVALIAVAVIVIALAYWVQIATPPPPSPTPAVTPTVPAPTPAPPTPHPVIDAFKVEFDPASSYGFDRIYSTNGWPVFEISRGKSATIAVVVTSLVNETLNIHLDCIEGVPVGVELKLEPERFTLQPYKRIALNLTVTVSPTARTSTPPPPATPETPTPGGPTPLPTPGGPETPTVTPTPPTPIAADYIVVYLTTGGIVKSTGGWGGFGTTLVLSIV